VHRPGEIGAADINDVRLEHGSVYLTGLMEVWMRDNHGWHLGRTLQGIVKLVFSLPVARHVFARALLLFARSNPLAGGEMASPLKNMSGVQRQSGPKLKPAASPRCFSCHSSARFFVSLRRLPVDDCVVFRVDVF
jgi:hypothetical protein